VKQFETRPSILSRLFAKHLVAVVVEGQSFENSDVTSLAASRGAIGVALFASMFNQRLCLPTTVSANDCVCQRRKPRFVQVRGLGLLERLRHSRVIVSLTRITFLDVANGFAPVPRRTDTRLWYREESPCSQIARLVLSLFPTFPNAFMADRSAVTRIRSRNLAE